MIARLNKLITKINKGLIILIILIILMDGAQKLLNVLLNYIQ